MKLRRLAALAAAMVMTFGVAGSVFANAANPESIGAQVSVNDVTLNGTWSWLSQAGACSDRWVGWAVDWNDPSDAGNAVAGTGFHVGTASDNAVHTNQNCGALNGDGLRVGTWGDISHTYPGPGTYHACVLMYDIHLNSDGQPKAATELVAGGADGSDHNDDNSAETNGQTPEGTVGVNCIPSDIVVPPVPHITAFKTVAVGDGPFVHTNTAKPGDILHWKIVISNVGNADATPVLHAEDIAKILLHAKYNNDCNGGCEFDGTALKWVLGNLAAGGDPVELNFSVTLDSAFPVGTTDIPNAVLVDGPGSNCADVENDADCSTTTTVSAQAVATPVPAVTPPPTDALGGTTNDAGGTLPLMLIVLGVIGLGAVVLTPSRKKR